MKLDDGPSCLSRESLSGRVPLLLDVISALVSPSEHHRVPVPTSRSLCARPPPGSSQPTCLPTKIWLYPRRLPDKSERITSEGAHVNVLAVVGSGFCAVSCLTAVRRIRFTGRGQRPSRHRAEVDATDLPGSFTCQLLFHTVPLCVCGPSKCNSLRDAVHHLGFPREGKTKASAA